LERLLIVSNLLLFVARAVVFVCVVVVDVVFDASIVVVITTIVTINARITTRRKTITAVALSFIIQKPKFLFDESVVTKTLFSIYCLCQILYEIREYLSYIVN
jgi:hypothetical protein